jgi:hypothetical protein
MVLIAVSIPTLRPLTHRNHVLRTNNLNSSGGKTYALSHVHSMRDPIATGDGNNFEQIPGKQYNTGHHVEVFGGSPSDDKSDSGSGAEILNHTRTNSIAELKPAKRTEITMKTSISTRYEQNEDEERDGVASRSWLKGPDPQGHGYDRRW